MEFDHSIIAIEALDGIFVIDDGQHVGAMERSTTKISPSWMLAPVMESPINGKKKVAALLPTRNMLRSRLFSI
jgi:hypothetical protein